MRTHPLRLLSAGLFSLLLSTFALADPAPIRVVVWDEQQPKQKEAYDNFLGNAIADYLKSKQGFTVQSVKLDDPQQGISDETLDHCDVLIWWGHVRNRDVKLERGKEIAKRIKSGKLSLIALHSAHWSSPFVEAMWERAQDDALASLPEAERAKAKVTTVYPKLYTVPKRDAALTPSFEKKIDSAGNIELVVQLPYCVFPAYRADGKPGHLTTLLPDHPIAAGVPKTFDVPQTEMYDEPFHVPTPDAVVFEEKWDKGEHFRSGCVWNVGRGKVFYFRPGHETFPVYKQEIPLKIVENAARWLGGEVPKTSTAAASQHVAVSPAGLLTGALLAEPMKNDAIPFFVGTYTGPKSKGIYTIRLDPATGSLSTPELVGEVQNPSFLWMHPSRKYLYAAGELDNFHGKKGGAVSAFAIDPATLKLTLLNQQSAGGGGTCFVSTDNTGKVALVANYGGGSVESLPIGDDGKLGEPATFVQHAGKVADPKRQQGPHAHSIWCTPDNRYAIAADLGLDKLFFYKLDPATAKLTPNDPPAVQTEPRFGPRHFAFHPNGKWVYAIGEIACRIDAFTYDADKGSLTEIGSVPTLDREVKPSDSTAEIVVHPNGKFVYGSNRGADEIAIFLVDRETGKLSPAGRVASGGKIPRNFAIDPTGTFLITAHQSSNNLFVFKIDPLTGALTPTGGMAEVGSPVCIRFLTPGR